jgi:hypothetical protein
MRNRNLKRFFGFMVVNPTMTPLQERVYGMNVCAHCHTKTMNHIHTAGGIRWLQCAACKTVACLPESEFDGNP